MNIPAYAVPTLSIGSTFDCNTSRNGLEIFPSDIPTKTENVNKFSFRYKVITTNDEVKELLDLPLDLPLRIKANQLSVEGPGKYLNELKIEGGKTEILAVMKCITVSKKIEDSAKPNEVLKRDNLVDGLGTHYVRRISYGGQMVASIKLDFPPSSTRPGIAGQVEGHLTSEAVAEALSKQFNTMSTDCQDTSNMSITCYTTDVHYQTATAGNLEELLNLFRNFGSRPVNGGTPIEVELQPTKTLIPSAKAYLPNQVLANTIEEVETRLDDLRSAQCLVKKYQESDVEFGEDMQRFRRELKKVWKIFADAVSTLNVSEEESQFDDCLTAYENALDGYDEEGKFVHFWKKLLSKKKVGPSSMRLPQGKDLSVVVIGKTGNGKSATANSIVGKHIFTTTAWATSAVSSECQFGRRLEERKIDVLDTPGFLKGEFEKEIPRILEWAPNGFDAIILVAKYGCRLTAEDAEGLQLLQGFLGDQANKYIILVVTYADQAEHVAKEDRTSMSQEGVQLLWLESLPDWANSFIKQIDERVVFFNNRLKPDSQSDAYKEQLSQLIQAIDAITKTTAPYLHTKESREDFQRKIKEAMRKPTQKKRKTPEDEWVLLPRDKPVAVPVGDTHVTGDQRSLRERFWHFVDTHCHIL